MDQRRFGRRAERQIGSGGMREDREDSLIIVICWVTEGVAILDTPLSFLCVMDGVPISDPHLYLINMSYLNQVSGFSKFPFGEF